MNRRLAFVAALMFAAPSALFAQTVFTYTQSDNTGNNYSLGYPVPVAAATQTSFAGFRDYASLFARHQDLMLTEDIVTGQQIGTSFAGRAIWAYVVTGTNANTIPSNTQKAAVQMTSGVHAREWGPPEVTTGIMEKLVANKADHSLHQYLIENLRIVLTPVLNVDGYMQGQRFPNQYVASSKTNTAIDGRQRRKNMRGVDEVLSTVADRAAGVDLNRNHQYGFGGGSATSTSETYRGTGIGSEPESQALYGSETLGPATRVRAYTDCHSYTKVYITPYSNTARVNTIRDSVVAKIISAVGVVNGSSYTYDPSPVSNAVGATDEYFAFKYDAISYTTEIEPANSTVEYGGLGRTQDGFILPESQIARVRDDIARGQFLCWYHMAGPPSIHSMRITHPASTTVVQDLSWAPATSTTRSLNRPVNMALTKGETYELWLSFTKPMRWRSAGLIANYSGQSVTLAPTITLTGIGDGAAPINIPVTVTTAAWRNAAGGAGVGYLNYIDDALLVTFTVPPSIPVLTTANLTLNVTTTDMSGLALDGRPETVADWASGWSFFENAAGTAGDVGGTDSRISFAVQAGGSGVQSWTEH